MVLTAEGQVYDPRTGPEGEVAKRRRDVVDERLRAATVHRTAAEAARAHFLYNMTGWYKFIVCKFSCLRPFQVERCRNCTVVSAATRQQVGGLVVLDTTRRGARLTSSSSAA